MRPSKQHGRPQHGTAQRHSPQRSSALKLLCERKKQLRHRAHPPGSFPMLSDRLCLPSLVHIVCVVLRCCRAAVAVREEVHEVLPGTVPAGGPGGGARLLTLEQLAAMDRASGGAAGSRGADKPHKAKVGAMHVCVCGGGVHVHVLMPVAAASSSSRRATLRWTAPTVQPDASGLPTTPRSSCHVLVLVLLHWQPARSAAVAGC